MIGWKPGPKLRPGYFLDDWRGVIGDPPVSSTSSAAPSFKETTVVEREGQGGHLVARSPVILSGY